MRQQLEIGTVWLGGLAAVGAMLAGCSSGVGGGTAATPSALAVSRPTGNVHGGQNPVTGATIQLYAVNAATSKGLATPLLTAPVFSDANGNFSITGLYSCSGSGLVYLTATGGDSGSGTNNALSLMVALGPCSALTPSTFVQVNEVTTVATAYALAPFMANYTHVGAANTASAQQGISNAFATVPTLVTVAAGLSPGAGLPAGVVVPSAELNSLANILAACVNTPGGDSNACMALFNATGATETAGAALAFAGNPSAPAITALYSLSTPSAPFQPSLALSAAPKDWTVAVKYAYPGLATPYGLAVDAAGSVWAANEGGNSVTKLSAAGALLGNYTAGGLLQPRAVAIDKSGNAWVANTAVSSVVELSSTGTLVSAPFTAGGISAPASIAIDSQNKVWVSNGNGNSITALTSAGAPANGSPLGGAGNISNPAGLAIDATGNVWVSSTGPATVAKFSNAGALLSGTGYSDGSLLHPQGVALDASGNAWVAANQIGGVSAFANGGTALPSSPVMGGGLLMPVGVAIDGAGTIWLANASASGSLSKVIAGQAMASSPSAGLGVLNTPQALAIDGSGNIWTANSGDSTVSEFIGLATPVVTPLAATVGP